MRSNSMQAVPIKFIVTNFLILALVLKPCFSGNFKSNKALALTNKMHNCNPNGNRMRRYVFKP